MHHFIEVTVTIDSFGRRLFPIAYTKSGLRINFLVLTKQIPLLSAFSITVTYTRGTSIKKKTFSF